MSTRSLAVNVTRIFRRDYKGSLIIANEKYISAWVFAETAVTNAEKPAVAGRFILKRESSN